MGNILITKMDMKTIVILDKAQKELPLLLGDICAYLEKTHKFKTTLKNKNDSKSLVTQADVGIQEIFEQWVFDNFNNHTVVGEEKDIKNDSSDWIWYIDPIAGPNLFSRNIEEWGVIISLTYKELPLISWVYFPYTKTIYFSRKDKGSFKSGIKIQTSKVDMVKKSIISGVYLNSLDREEIMLGKLWKESLWGIVGRSLARDFCDLAEGKIDIAVCYQCYSWEYKALNLLVEEAGGVCSGFAKLQFNVLETKPQNITAFANKRLMEKGTKLIKVPPS